MLQPPLAWEQGKVLVYCLKKRGKTQCHYNEVHGGKCDQHIFLH